ncbi:MAG: hypothetical protein LBI99_08480 [Propionibacteriaceae bacterium]|jgi:hypothetical protein|nr:hypothetical protein [Propionibacteriaceae bacterium]
MQIEGKNLSVKNDEGDVLFDNMSFLFRTGEFTILATDDTQKAVTFAMLASGRLRKYTGSLSASEELGTAAEAAFNLRELRNMTAVPFVPVIGEPDEFLKAWRVLKEEFLFAGENVSRESVLEYMGSVMGVGPAGLASLRLKSVPGPVRIKMFTELAAMRPGVRFVFVTHPERYAGLPNEWFAAIKEIQHGDNAVILLTTKVVAEFLNEGYYDLDDSMKYREPKPSAEAVAAGGGSLVIKPGAGYGS